MENNLISREVALNGIDKNIANLRHHAGNNCVANSAINLVQYTRDFIAALPSVDAVEVVRCRDCKHLMFSDCYGECGEGHMGIVSPDDFCSYGRRKEGDDNG